MSSLLLKIIALLTMITDHYGAIFQSNIIIYRIIGRLAFPIYCFLLVEGYMHTSNVKKYAVRLIIFAFISEIPFDLAFYGKIGLVHQNIYFTLFIGLATIYLLNSKNLYNKGEEFWFTNSLIIVTACILASILRVDYQFIGIIYILGFYKTYYMPKEKKFLFIALVMFVANISAGLIQQFSLLALIPIYFYNNRQGVYNKFIQISFYIAYPLHLFIFYIFKVL